MLFRTFLLGLLLSAALLGAADDRIPKYLDAPFVQEFHDPYPLGDANSNDVRAVAVDRQNRVWAATKSGVYRLDNGAWTPMMPEDLAGPAFDVTVDSNGRLWVAAWNGVYRTNDSDTMNKVPGIDVPVTVICALENGVAALGPAGNWRQNDETWEPINAVWARSIREAISDEKGGMWVSTGQGLYHHAGKNSRLYQLEQDLISAATTGVAFGPGRTVWVSGLGGVTVLANGEKSGELTPEDGLPNVYANCVAQAPDGVMWVGTTHGVVRFDGKANSLRHSRTWLLHNDVRDVAFDAEGGAWLATAGGVSAIKKRTMTLQEKADYYMAQCQARHVREPGLVEKCRLRVPGDLTTWEPRDDDNDGEYTSIYLAMESYRYAATGSEDARANAKRAFGALEFLRTVTGMPGFIARTVIPVEWARMADPNETFDERERADRLAGDPRFKPVEDRWRLSADGKWRWKGDTSSDEITGHFYGYLTYFNLAADAGEKDRVRNHVRLVMDYIIDGGYMLLDKDGKHTRWGVWAPDKLNHDPDWRPERGINAAEILSFLKVTYHITGDEKYEQAYRKLAFDEGYLEHVRNAKAYNPAWRTHIDDELLAITYPGLFLEKDPAILAVYQESLDHWYKGVADDHTPFLDIIYASLAARPKPFDESIEYLRDAPLDLVLWTVDNSQREDIRLRRAPEIEPMQTHPLPPLSERGVMRVDQNPWRAVQGEGGETESDGVFWLHPYWMGRWMGIISGLDN
ncbi:MAG: hypothetical protein AMXMBFR84_04590 [Candidatus Hydrogenedentota bacterium]